MMDAIFKMNTLLMTVGFVTLTVGGGFALAYACWGVGRLFNAATKEQVEHLRDRVDALFRRVNSIECKTEAAILPKKQTKKVSKK